MPLRSGAIDDGTVKGKTSLSLLSHKVDPTLVLDLPFSEGIGNTVRDRSLYGNHGTIYGATWIDGALSFDGINDYVRAPFPTQLLGNQSHTISMWIYVITPVSSEQVIYIGQSTPALRGFFIRIYGDETAYPRRSWRGFDAGGLSWLSPTLPTDTWFHLAEVYDSIATTSKLYFNEVLRSTGTGFYPAPGHLAAGYVDIGLAIGGWVYFKGFIKKVRVYNRALELAEIQLQ